MLPHRQGSACGRPKNCSHLNASRQPQAVRQRFPLQNPAATSEKAQLTPKEHQLLQYVVNYQYTLDTPEGQLVISPLRPQWLQRTGDLLADTFVDAKGIQPYRRYVRRNIGKYLDQHINMPPAAVLVTAILRSQVVASSASQLGLHDLQAAEGTQTAGSSSSSSNKQAGSSTQQTPQRDASMVRPVENPLGQLLLAAFGWLVAPNTPVTPPAGSSAGGSTSGSGGDDESGYSSNDSGGSSSSSSTMSASAASLTSSPATGSLSSAQNSSSSSRSVNGSAELEHSASSSAGQGTGSSTHTSNGRAGGPNVAQLVGSALQQLSGGVMPHLRGQQQPPVLHVVETLVGVAEVSFRDVTRSQALTLNPPQQSAYLCNMAVANDWRRKGIASTLLTAVEDICLLAGESDLYLHLRFKDATTAGSLYRKHGFQEHKKDCWLLLLLGQEPRYLMLKQLAADRTLVGQVALPGFKQGVTTAELQQQEEEGQQGQDESAVARNSAIGQAATVAPAASPAA